MNTPPTPPPGYKLVKGIDIKNCVPEGTLLWDSEDNGNNWFPSAIHGKTVPCNCLDFFYAIPFLTPAQNIEATKQSIIDEAKAIVANDRASDYGEANESFTRISKLWSTYTGTTITPWDVAQMMILLKVSRAKTSQKRDTLIDIIGYAECASKLNSPTP